MIRVILKENGKVLEIQPPEGTSDIVGWRKIIRSRYPAAEEYTGPWPEGSPNFKWDESTGTVVSDDEENEKELKIKKNSDRLVQERLNLGPYGITIDEAFDYIDNQIDSALTAQEKLDAIKRILKKMAVFIIGSNHNGY